MSMTSTGLSSTTIAPAHSFDQLRLSLARVAFDAPAMFTPVKRQSVAGYDGITVLAHGVEPSVAYYFRSRLDGQKVSFIDTRRTPPSAFSEQELSSLLHMRQIILVRRISSAWLKTLTHRRGETASIVYFMDDDLPGAALDPHLPLRYALCLTAGFMYIRSRLASICDQVLFSTPALAARYPEAKADTLPPLPLPDDNFAALDMCSHWSSPMFTIFYHGTSSHTRELAFVADVARIVQAQRHDTVFEVFGSRKTLKPFDGIPRMRKLHPMPWEDYITHARATPLHIGLAPLLETNFNAFRAATKFFDITRCRAVGLYSDASPFNKAIQNHHSGVLLKENPRDWAKEILNLLKEPSIAVRMAKNAADNCIGPVHA